jgi:hypothetical protein
MRGSNGDLVWNNPTKPYYSNNEIKFNHTIYDKSLIILLKKKFRTSNTNLVKIIILCVNNIGTYFTTHSKNILKNHICNN